MESSLGLDDLPAFCKKIRSKLCEKQILLLKGNLGRGKTTLVQYLVEEFGGEGALSPTFSLINEYSCRSKRIVHVDLYRLESGDDLESTGFWDLFDQDSGLVIIEWPERLNQDELPVDWDVHAFEPDFVVFYAGEGFCDGASALSE